MSSDKTTCLGLFYFKKPMIKTIHTDEQGRKQAYYVNEYMSDPTEGIPVNVPRVEDLDWDAIKLEIHNSLVENGLFTWDDVQKRQTAITSILRATLLRKIIALYRTEE